MSDLTKSELAFVTLFDEWSDLNYNKCEDTRNIEDCSKTFLKKFSDLDLTNRYDNYSELLLSDMYELSSQGE